MTKLSVLILFGGASNEHDVSLRSATSVIENLDTDRFEPVMMGITRDGRWRLFTGDYRLIRKGGWEEYSVPAVISPDRSVHGITVFDKETFHRRIDVAIPALHGQNCEDGAVQGLLKLSGIPFVGCSVAASAVGFDKAFTHTVCEKLGIPMAKWLLATASEEFESIRARVEESLGFPCFVKPANSGSSVGCSRADDAAALKRSLAIAFNEDSRVLIEELIVAHEVECAVLGNDELYIPTTGEIVSPDGFYDYDSKYTNDNARLLIPADIPKASHDKVRELAGRIFRALGCRGLSRVDFFVKEDGSVIFNEINTFPGFTSISMYPKMITASGISYPQLITRLIELALE